MAENKKEINLSEKLIECATGDIIEGCEEWYYHLRKGDVKEFIRLLKKEAKKYRDKDIDINFALDFNVIINKLAGDKLYE